jgi:hypothetical protein
LDEAVTKRADRITRNLIGTNFGSWSIHEVPAVRKIFRNKPVNAVDVLMDAERKTQADRDDELIIRECEPFYKQHVQLIADRKQLLARIDLRSNERYVVSEMLGAGWTVGELVAYGGMLERPLLRLLEGLKGMGLVEYVDEEGDRAKRNRAERILWIGMRDLNRRSVFEAVYSHWSSTEWEIEKGYRRLLAELGPGRFADVADERIKQLMRDIRAKIDEIYSKLSDRRGREEARKGIVGPDQLLMAVELLDKQAQLALWKSDFAFAKACYERVLDLDPGTVEAGEARRNARKAMADPRVSTAQEPGEAVLRRLHAQVDAAID